MTRTYAKSDPQAKAAFLDMLRANPVVTVREAAEKHGIALGSAYMFASKAGIKRDQSKQRSMQHAMRAAAGGTSTPFGMWAKTGSKDHDQQKRNYDHALKVSRLPPVEADEAARLVAEFLAKRAPTVCPSPKDCGDGNNFGTGW